MGGLSWISRKMFAGSADYSQQHAAGPDDPKFRRRTWAKANPSMAHMPDLEAGNPHRSGAGSPGPGLAGVIRGAEAQSRDRGRRSLDAPGRGPVSVNRGRGGTGRRVRMGRGPWHVSSAVGHQRVLAADGRAGLSGGLPCGAVPCRAWAEGWRRRTLFRVRAVWRTARPGTALGGHCCAVGGGARPLRPAVADRR